MCYQTFGTFHVMRWTAGKCKPIINAPFSFVLVFTNCSGEYQGIYLGGSLENDVISKQWD